jgi:hypothetical protein
LAYNSAGQPQFHHWCQTNAYPALCPLEVLNFKVKWELIHYFSTWWRASAAVFLGRKYNLSREQMMALIPKIERLGLYAHQPGVVAANPESFVGGH